MTHIRYDFETDVEKYPHVFKMDIVNYLIWGKSLFFGPVGALKHIVRLLMTGRGTWKYSESGKLVMERCLFILIS